MVQKEPVLGMRVVFSVITIAFSLGGAWAFVQANSYDMKENYVKKESLIRLEGKLDLVNYRLEKLTSAVDRSCGIKR